MDSSSTSTAGNSSESVDRDVDQRKRKRMLSNRESARRSRMRKQKHLDELASQAGELEKDNARIGASLGVAARLCARLEAENAILAAQMAELASRLQSLNDIVRCVSAQDIDMDQIVLNGGDYVNNYNYEMMVMMNNPWNTVPTNHPIMASADQMYMH